MVLGEKILAVEVIVDALVSGDVGVQVRIAGADITTVESQLEMLDRDMALPFILRAQGDITAVVGEGADELPLCWLGSLGS
jgi:hypothetical protein